MDKTGPSNVQNPFKIVASKDAKEDKKMTRGERGKSVTVIFETNAAETYSPPMFVCPRKRMVDVLNNARAGAIDHCIKTDWTDKKFCLKWLIRFSSIGDPSSKKST